MDKLGKHLDKEISAVKNLEPLATFFDIPLQVSECFKDSEQGTSPTEMVLNYLRTGYPALRVHELRSALLWMERNDVISNLDDYMYLPSLKGICSSLFKQSHYSMHSMYSQYF